MIDDMYVAAPESLPTSRTDNPYWDMILTLPGNTIDWRYEHVWSPDWSATWRWEKPIHRNELCGKYTWAIPDPDSLAFVAHWLSPQGVEMGAGSGYWAWQLTQLGVDMFAYDETPPQLKTGNHWHSPRTGPYGELLNETRSIFFSVQEGKPDILSQHTDRTLFLSWPPMSDMASDCLKTYQGKRLVYIGEDDGGCTADDAFFAQLTEDWVEVASHRPIQWWAIHDWITVYERVS